MMFKILFSVLSTLLSQHHIALAIIALIYFLPLSLFAQTILGELAVEEVEQPGMWINSIPDKAMLIVYTDVDGVSFATNNFGVIEAKEIQKAVWQVLLMPGTHIITYTVSGFKSVDDRIYIDAGKVGERKLVVVKEPAGGRGNIKIETIPPGAEVKFNNILLPDKTPLNLKDQPTGKHTLHFELPGYSAKDTIVTVEKDKTLTYKFTLQREYATLIVDTDPKGAEVFWEGKSLGTTPLTCDTLSPGEKEITIKKRGYINRTETVRLKAGEPKSLNFDLILQTGSVEIVCDQNGAEIFFDEVSLGFYQGKAIAKDKIPLGKHTVKAILSGYEDAVASFEAQFAQPNSIDLNLKPKPGALFVSSTPEGAEIWLDGSNSDQKTAYNPVKIPIDNPGDYRVTLKKSEYQDTTQTVKIPPGGSKTIDIAMKAKPKPPPSPAGSGVIASEAKQSLSKIKGPLTGMEFVLIPAGSFTMGSPDNEKDRGGDEGPQHKVNIKSFYLMTTEVTQKMWTEVMGSNPSYFKGDNLPVESVNWNDCQDFIKKLNQRDPGKNYRLPSEAEREYACRAGTKTRFYSGNNDSDLDAIAWYYGNSGSKTHPVWQKRANAWGLYDMSGNVWEWCSDWYHDSYNGAPSDGSSWEYPQGQYRVVRGGSWLSFPSYCRSSFRYWFEPVYRSSGIGFRVACSP
jgi:formylglycine-generating enzyme required for sulfatase activity